MQPVDARAISIAPSQPNARGILALTLLSVLTFAAGLALIIGYNWESIPPTVRVALLIAAVFVAFALSAAANAKAYALPADLLAVLGVSLHGASIWLIATVLEMEGYFPDTLQWWSLGVVASALLLRRFMVSIAAAVALAAWALAMLGNGRMPDEGRTLWFAAAGAVCATILSGMVVMHAWPLRTGVPLVLELVAWDPRDLTEGHPAGFVRLDTRAARLLVGIPDPPFKDSSGQIFPPLRPHVPVKAVGPFWEALSPYDEDGCSPRIVYVQFRPSDRATHADPVSISLERLDGALNLRGRINCRRGSDEFYVDYGFEQYVRDDKRGRQLDAAMRDHRRVELELAVTPTGASRVRRVLVDGAAVPDDPAR